MGKDFRVYRDESTHHVYIKAVDGNVIFYSRQDCIFYLTLYYHLAKRYGIRTQAFSIMPNHTHSNERAPSREKFFLFHCRLASDFSRGYNARHNRSGSLFMKTFGFAPKTVGKKIRDNIAYIFNNPVVGKLTDDIEEYRWNLLAYRNSDHPFSEKIRLNKASYRLRRSISLLNYYFEHDIPLDYTCQKVLYKGLSNKESAQLTDRIVSMHNCLDYNAIAGYYQGDMEKAMLTIRANSGSEYDIQEDYEDYRSYKYMVKMTRDLGIDLETCNFEKSSEEELEFLTDKFSCAGIPSRQIRKFLHLSVECKGLKD